MAAPLISQHVFACHISRRAPLRSCAWGGGALASSWETLSSLLLLLVDRNQSRKGTRNAVLFGPLAETFASAWSVSPFSDGHVSRVGIDPFGSEIFSRDALCLHDPLPRSFGGFHYHYRCVHGLSRDPAVSEEVVGVRCWRCSSATLPGPLVTLLRCLGSFSSWLLDGDFEHDSAC